MRIRKTSWNNGERTTTTYDDAGEYICAQLSNLVFLLIGSAFRIVFFIIFLPFKLVCMIGKSKLPGILKIIFIIPFVILCGIEIIFIISLFSGGGGG